MHHELVSGLLYRYHRSWESLLEQTFQLWLCPWQLSSSSVT